MAQRVPQDVDPSELSPGQKRKTLAFAMMVSGYSAFSDSMRCLFMLKPLPEEYQFAGKIDPKTWLLVCGGTMVVYGLSTLMAEGKCVYDLTKDHYVELNKKKLHQFHPPGAPATPPVKAKKPSALTLGLVWVLPRLITGISAFADSAETTMGLYKQQASLAKIIGISSLSFLGSFAFYTPFAAEAMNDMCLDKKEAKAEEVDRDPHLLAKLIGYPVGVFSSTLDTLESATSFFQIFSITGSISRWATIGVSSLVGVSGFSLDGRQGVKIIDNFICHLDKNYDWLPRMFTEGKLPTQEQVLKLIAEVARLATSAFLASFIAFADKELTISLTVGILATLGIQISFLPYLLGCCIVMRDFTIQTNTMLFLVNMLQDGLLSAGMKLKNYYYGIEATEFDLKETHGETKELPKDLISNDNDMTSLLDQDEVKEDKSIHSSFLKPRKVVSARELSQMFKPSPQESKEPAFQPLDLDWAVGALASRHR